MQSYLANGDPTAKAWLPADAQVPTDGAQGAVALLPCNNRQTAVACNWMLDDPETGSNLCGSCRLTRTIPDLSVPGNPARWARIEAAKRRLLFGLQSLGLWPETRHMLAANATSGGSPANSLCFDLLADTHNGQHVHTGHDNGVITLNIAEADDHHRELMRLQLGEPQRTLLGHLRHEVAHYLQFRWIDADADRTERCRAVFGDERQNYAAALANYYQTRAPMTWSQYSISAYATAHPWEDWAETCAHWLLIVDAVQTAIAWGLRLDGPSTTRPNAVDPSAPMAAQALVLQHWLPVAQFLNAMNRSIGVPDSYPFLIPPPVLAKLGTVQLLLAEAARDGLEAPGGGNARAPGSAASQRVPAATLCTAQPNPQESPA